VKIVVVANGFPPHGMFGTERYAGEIAGALRARGHEVIAFVPARDAHTTSATGVHGVRIEFAPPIPASKRLTAAWSDAGVEARFDALLASERPHAVHFLQLFWGLSVELVTRARARGVRTVLVATDYGLFCHRGQMFDADEKRCFGPHPAATCARCLRRRSASSVNALERSAHSAFADLAAACGGVFGAVTTHDVELREAAVARALAAADAVIAPTAHMAELLAPRLARPAVVLPYAFDEAPYAAAARRTAPHAPHAVRFGFFGQFAPHKGLHVLLDAFPRAAARLKAVGRSARLSLFGASPPGRRGRYARRLLAHLPQGVTLEPPFAAGDAPRHLADLTALVVPSSWDENAPLSVLEARAAGVAVVASDVPGIRAVCDPGVHGLLVPPDDAAALADALVEVCDLAHVPCGLPLTLREHVDTLVRLLTR
jgi:glycosyltransferase involved in cell wall biosynthesis